jgi:hypothetical protein
MNHKSMLAAGLGLTFSTAGLGYANACQADADCSTGKVCSAGKCAEPANAKAATGADSGEHASAGKAGIITGYVFDGIGYIGIVAGGAISSESLGAGLGLMYVGSASLALASLIGTASYTYRHGAYKDAGFAPRSGPMAGAWVLTILSIGCVGAAFPVGFMAADQESLGLALASLGLAVGGGIFEAINLSVRGSWERALKEAPKAGSPTAFMVHPTVIRVPVQGGFQTVPGLGASFAF